MVCTRTPPEIKTLLDWVRWGMWAWICFIILPRPVPDQTHLSKTGSSTHSCIDTAVIYLFIFVTLQITFNTFCYNISINQFNSILFLFLISIFRLASVFNGWYYLGLFSFWGFPPENENLSESSSCVGGRNRLKTGKTTTANERVLFGNININIEHQHRKSNININIDINNTLITFKHLHLRICRACFNMSSTHGVACTAYSSPSPIDAYKFHNMLCISYWLTFIS